MTTPLTVAGAVLADLDVELDATRAVLGCLRPALWDAPTYPDAWTIGQLARHLVEVVYWLETVVAAEVASVSVSAGHPSSGQVLRSGQGAAQPEARKSPSRSPTAESGEQGGVFIAVTSSLKNAP